MAEREDAATPMSGTLSHVEMHDLAEVAAERLLQSPRRRISEMRLDAERLTTAAGADCLGVHEAKAGVMQAGYVVDGRALEVW